MLQGKSHDRTQLLLAEAYLYLFHLAETLARAARCCDPVAMENWYILGSLAALLGRIAEENIFPARKYYREMFICSLNNGHYRRYARGLHYRAWSFIMSSW